MLRVLTTRLAVSASLALCAAIGGGWKWERLPVPLG